MPDCGTPTLAIRLFGAFEVQVKGAPLPRLRSRKGGWLLALLALRYGREVERDWLIGLLWPESGETQARRNLRNTLRDLRRALGPAAPHLRSPTLHTLLLDSTDAEIDIVTFDRAIARADRDPLLRVGSSRRCMALEEAVALYRGPLLEGWVEEWVFAERRAREQSYLQALETLAHHAMCEGNVEAAERQLRLAVAVDPLRESAQRALMQVQSAGGNYAGTVLTYRELRLLLHRELNVEPDPETQALFHQLRIAGRRRVQTPAPAPASPHRPALGDSSHNLPAPLTRFIGREQAIDEVKERLAKTRLLTLTGAGGCGKTRLALQVGAEVLEEYGEGVWLVDLAPLADPARVPQAVASALEVREEPGRPLIESLIDALRRKELLLVLDNCEHLIDACAALAQTLLQACPRIRVLATSRQVLGMAGESAWRVPSLSFPEPSAAAPPRAGSRGAGKAVAELLGYEAVQLFVERAAASQPRFAVTTANAAAVTEICQRLDGIPLAIELAAARVKALSVEQIAERLDDRFRLLAGGNRTALPRHQTLRALIDWSYDLLSEAEQALLHRLSVFAGGWTLEAAEAVCAGESVEAWEVIDLLTSLVNKSLVGYDDQSGEGRYRLLETVRQHARDRLLEAGEGESVRERHRNWFLDLAEQGEPELVGARQREWLDRLEREHDNLRAALGWSRAAGQSEAGLRLAGALVEFWFQRGYWTEGHEQLAGLLALPGAEAPTVGRAKALYGAELFARQQGDHKRAQAFLEECLAISQAIDYKKGIAYALGESARLARDRGEPETAQRLLEECLAIQRELDNKHGIAWSLLGLANVADAQGDDRTAQALLEECLAIHRETGWKGGIAWLLNRLALTALARKECGTAQELWEECLVIHQELGNKQGIASGLFGLGAVFQARGEYQAAQALYEQSLALYQELGGKHGILWSFESLAGLAATQGQAERAAVLWGMAEELREGMGLPLRSAERVEPKLATVRGALGKEAFAVAWAAGRAMSLEEAVECALRHGDDARDGEGRP